MDLFGTLIRQRRDPSILIRSIERLIRPARLEKLERRPKTHIARQVDEHVVHLVQHRLCDRIDPVVYVIPFRIARVVFGAETGGQGHGVELGPWRRAPDEILAVLLRVGDCVLGARVEADGPIFWLRGVEIAYFEERVRVRRGKGVDGVGLHVGALLFGGYKRTDQKETRLFRCPDGDRPRRLITILGIIHQFPCQLLLIPFPLIRLRLTHHGGQPAPHRRHPLGIRIHQHPQNLQQRPRRVHIPRPIRQHEKRRQQSLDPPLLEPLQHPLRPVEQIFEAQVRDLGH